MKSEDEDSTDKKKKKRTAAEAELDLLISDTLQKMNTRREEASMRDEERLAIERERSKREEKSATFEENERKQRLISSLWEDYDRASASTNNSQRKRAERLKQKIADLEGIPVDDL